MKGRYLPKPAYYPLKGVQNAWATLKFKYNLLAHYFW